ncbi:hypothetical protein, partial [Agriterribacter sp.]|uniref:hypothetical protein n=1 Tax=Agriterribacter sp. TaxID=2821509 RepID=UPI002D15751A
MKETDLNISIPGGSDLRFTREIPARLERYIIEGSQVFTVESSFGSLLVQLVDLPHYNFQYIILDCREDIALRRKKNGIGLKMDISLQNTMDWEYRGIDDARLGENYCNIFY